MDIFYLVAYALIYFTGKSCFSNKLRICGGEMLPVPYCNRKIQAVDMNSEIMLQSRQITSFCCPSHLLPVLLDLPTPFLFLWFTWIILVLYVHVLVYKHFKVFKCDAAILQDGCNTAAARVCISLPGVLQRQWLQRVQCMAEWTELILSSWNSAGADFLPDVNACVMVQASLDNIRISPIDIWNAMVLRNYLGRESS